MSVWKLPNIALLILFALFCFCTGCVERKLTIITEPSGALVTLNDEEIGISPVTVGFEWYGDYSVRATKEGYQVLNTHKNLKRPLCDVVAFDFLDDTLNTRVDEYIWTFKLEPYQEPNKAELIEDALKMKDQTTEEMKDPFEKKYKKK